MANKKTENIPTKLGPGPGRPLGSPNKTTAAIKDMIIQSLSEAGGVDYLVARARDTPAAYMALLGRVLPMQVTGDGGGPVAIELLTTYRLPENGR